MTGLWIKQNTVRILFIDFLFISHGWFCPESLVCSASGFCPLRQVLQAPLLQHILQEKRIISQRICSWVAVPVPLLETLPGYRSWPFQALHPPLTGVFISRFDREIFKQKWPLCYLSGSEEFLELELEAVSITVVGVLVYSCKVCETRTG